MFKINRKNKGFTLIELLVVISIIGLLSSIILSSVTKARDKAQNSATVQGINQYLSVLDRYFLDKGYYPNPYSNPVSMTLNGFGSQQIVCLGSQGGTACQQTYSDPVFLAQLQPYYTAWPNPAPYGVNGNLNGALYWITVTQSPPSEKIVMISWPKPYLEPCVIPYAYGDSDNDGVFSGRLSYNCYLQLEINKLRTVNFNRYII